MKQTFTIIGALVAIVALGYFLAKKFPTGEHTAIGRAKDWVVDKTIQAKTWLAGEPVEEPASV